MSEELKQKLWEIDDATRFKPKRYRMLKLALLELDPHCHWCGKEVFDLPDTTRHAPTPHNMATIDHLVSRFVRKKGERVVKVLACSECNQKRGWEEEREVIRRRRELQC